MSSVCIVASLLHVYSLQKSGRDVLTDETTRRELVRGLTDRVAEIEKDHESIKRLAT